MRANPPTNTPNVISPTCQPVKDVLFQRLNAVTLASSALPTTSTPQNHRPLERKPSVSTLALRQASFPFCICHPLPRGASYLALPRLPGRESIAPRFGTFKVKRTEPAIRHIDTTPLSWYHPTRRLLYATAQR